jgi:hypothetical protein
MGVEEYYRVLGQAVDDQNFAEALNAAANTEELKNVIRNRAAGGIELVDPQDLDAVKEAAKHLTGFSRPGPGRKYRR